MTDLENFAAAHELAVKMQQGIPDGTTIGQVLAATMVLISHSIDGAPAADRAPLLGLLRNTVDAMGQGSLRGTVDLDERDVAAMLALEVGYYWINHQDGMRLLFLGLVKIDEQTGHFTPTDAGIKMLEEVNS